MALIPPPPNYEGLPAPLEMTVQEKALRDTFVAEYLVDYNGLKACMRCGFPREFAIEWSQKLLDEAYVQKRITELSMFAPNGEDQEKGEADYNKQRIKAQLLKEAHYYGPGSSHAARVSALKNLAVIYGMEAPKKIDANIAHQGGVMRAPGIAELDSWEQSASSSQEALTRDAAT